MSERSFTPMTSEEVYATKGKNPNTGIWVNEWHCYGSAFMPQKVKVKEELIQGMRTIGVSDLASGFFMDFEAIPEKPNSIESSQIISLIERVNQKYGKPTKGIVISHSCWLSSSELANDKDTRDQGEFLDSIEVNFEAMSPSTKDEILAWGVTNDLTIIFDADEIPLNNAKSHLN